MFVRSPAHVLQWSRFVHAVHCTWANCQSMSPMPSRSDMTLSDLIFSETNL
jgi:hypothetical protein